MKPIYVEAAVLGFVYGACAMLAFQIAGCLYLWSSL